MTLQRAGRALLLAAALAACISGCGSASGEDKNAKQSLIGLEDLPDGATMKEEFPEPCAPEPILEEGRSKIAVSKPLGFETTTVKEAIGIFPEEEKATKAYKELTSAERSECIGKAMQGFNPPEDNIETGSVSSFDTAEEDWTRQYLLIDPNSNVTGSLDVAALRSGSCVATLIFLTKSKQIEAGVVQEVTEAAADLLPGSC
jgi:hypothetical protein